MYVIECIFDSRSDWSEYYLFYYYKHNVFKNLVSNRFWYKSEKEMRYRKEYLHKEIHWFVFILYMSKKALLYFRDNLKINKQINVYKIYSEMLKNNSLLYVKNSKQKPL